MFQRLLDYFFLEKKYYLKSPVYERKLPLKLSRLFYILLVLTVIAIDQLMIALQDNKKQNCLYTEYFHVPFEGIQSVVKKCKKLKID